MSPFNRIFVLSIVTVSLITNAYAQNNQVDSVLQWLNEASTTEGLDTTKFTKSLSHINELELTEQQIYQIEDAAAKLDGKSDQILKYIVKSAIISSLNGTDTDKAITYGKTTLQELESASWPYSDWIKSYILKLLRLPYRNSDRVGEGIVFFSEKLVDAKAKNDSIILASCHYVLGGFYSGIALQDQAIYHMQKSISHMDSTLVDKTLFYGPNPRGRGMFMNNNHVLGLFYKEAGEYKKALAQFSFVISMSDSSLSLESVASKGAAETYLAMDSLSPVPGLLKVARSRFPNETTGSFPVVLNQLEALYCIMTGNFNKAEALLAEAWKAIRKENIPPAPFSGTVNPDYYLALLKEAQGDYKAAIDYVIRDIERVANLRAELLKDYILLAELYEKIGNGDKAAEAYVTYIALQKDVLDEQAAFRKSSFELEQEMTERELSIANLENENRITGLTRNFTIGLALLLLLLAIVVYSRFRTKQRDNKLLSETLSDLKSTQAQLVQSEKMASLGELTAGIAHEIQNPLNFVNNFSEVSQELIDEMAEEINKGDLEEVKELSADIKGNLEKITHHGKRADAIVKGMLAHSRSGKGEKAPTDINALAEEYLKLSYHGLRAKDKSFNADFKTDFDPNLPKVNVVPQDIGRVLLNLINNAFQAVNERSKSEVSDYVPLVTIRTELTADSQQLIAISDNGPGIPNDIKDKIFQPFFTTKPTGQGTGLGLSLSYDIVKAHGGDLSVMTRENEGSEFVISLPTD